MFEEILILVINVLTFYLVLVSLCLVEITLLLITASLCSLWTKTGVGLLWVAFFADQQECEYLDIWTSVIVIMNSFIMNQE